MAKNKINKKERSSPGHPEIQGPRKPEKNPEGDKVDPDQINDAQKVEPIQIDEPEKIDPVQIKFTTHITKKLFDILE